MTQRLKKTMVLFSVLFLIIVIAAIPLRYKIKSKLIYYYGAIKIKFTGRGLVNCKDCNELFNDGVKTQEIAYQKEKIKEQKNDDGLLLLKQKGALKEISSNKYYTLRDLDFSQPLLMPKAILLLNQLSKLYQQKCIDENIAYMPFEITSATRSIESAKKLTKTNNNARYNSAHLRGKTFDVSYNAFYKHERQLELFITSLYELKKQSLCFVKYEKNGCLHITVN